MPQTRSTTVAIIGAGRVGTTLGVLLERAGHRIVGATGRDASRERVARYLPTTPFLPPDVAAGHSETVIVGVVDDLIAQSVAAIAAAGAIRPGQNVVHLSGSMGLDLLDPARAAGAEVLSCHPLQSFPDVGEGLRRMPGSGVAVTARTEAGHLVGEALARDVRGVPFRLADDVKPLYHAAAVFCANYLVTVEAAAERVLRLAGIGDPLPLLEPLARTAFDRTFALGPQSALTGPASRGDTGTIDRNLSGLSGPAPDLVDAYVALARIAAGVAESAGRLAPAGRERVERELAPWR